MIVYSVDQQLAETGEAQSQTKNSKNRIASSSFSSPTPITTSNTSYSKCFITFAIVAISFIALCSIFMAIMTTSVFIRTSGLDADFLLRNKNLGSFFIENSNETLSDPNKLERNILSWLKDAFPKFFYFKPPKTDKPARPNSLAKPIISPECGYPAIQPRNTKTRIMNGKEAFPNSWPWTVSIGLDGPKEIISHACGGTLINKRTVLTAAHCVTKNSVYSLVGGPIRNDLKYGSVERMMRVYIGIHDRINDIKPSKIYGVENIKMHENFDPITFKNDIAILRLDRDVEVSNQISFVCLNKINLVQPGDSVFAVGWGYTEKSKTQASRFLMQVDLVVQTKDNCLIQYIDHDQFCAGNVYLKKDTCNGDSGGPLVKYVNNKWTLVGIVSNGDVSCSGTGIYTNVAYFFDWIMLYGRF